MLLTESLILRGTRALRSTESVNLVKLQGVGLFERFSLMTDDMI